MKKNGGSRKNGSGRGKNGGSSRSSRRGRSRPSETYPAGAPKRFWLAGATGFLGSHLLRLLRERGHDVVAVSLSGGEVADTQVAALDVIDADAVAESARGCDGAFLATGKVSRDPALAEELHRANVLATRSALAGLKRAGVPRVVLASTSGTLAVGTRSDQIFNEDSGTPMEIIARWPYYRSKYYAEREALEADAPDFEVVVVNPSLLLGPGDVNESSTGDVRRFLERSIPAVPSGGLSFVDARDAALGMLLAFERGRAGERYLLTAKNLTVAAFFQRLERMTGVSAPRLPLPSSRPLALGLSQVFSRAVRAIGGEPPVDEVSVEMAQYFWYCSSEKAELELGWSARDPGETLSDTVRDIVERGTSPAKGFFDRVRRQQPSP